MPRVATPASTPTETALVVLICFGYFILFSIQAVLTGFPVPPLSDSSLLGTIILEGMLGTAALCFLYARAYPITELVPTPTGVGLLVGVALYAVAFLIDSLLRLAFGAAHPATQAINQMVAEASASLPVIIFVSVLNGFYEETFLIGYLFRATESLGGAFALTVTSLVRISYHLYQGPLGVLSVLGFGAVLGLYYWRTRKLWPTVVAHILGDLVVLTWNHW